MTNLKVHVAVNLNHYPSSQQAFICPKLTIETLEQGVKYVQN